MTYAQRVYVVDDDLSVSGSIRFLLATLKIGSKIFRNGREFLDQAETLRPGVVLLDLHMPDMDGFVVQEEMKRREINWPVILMTGTADMQAVTRAVRRGALDFILKPFSDEALLTALHTGFVQLKNLQPGLTAAQAQRQRSITAPRL